MKVTPMRRVASPKYPTKPEIDAQPELLRAVPQRWQSSQAVLLALTAMGVLAAPSATAQTTTAPKTAVAIDQVAIAGGIQAAPVVRLPRETVLATPADAAVAPVTNHGDGVGTTYGQDDARTAFLSESEARSIICDELQRAGIHVTQDSLTLADVPLPVTTRTGLQATAADSTGSERLFLTRMVPSIHIAPIAWPVEAKALQLDGAEEEHGIAFEYISSEDYDAWRKEEIVDVQAAPRYDLQRTARRVSAGISQQKDLTGKHIGVFYDPCVEPQDAQANATPGAAPDVTAATEDARMIARYELRQQVRDFLDWLKLQGVI